MKPVKPILAGLTFFLVVAPAPAEYRTVLIQVKQDKDKKVSVSIHSDEKEEQKSAALVDEAVKVIRAIKGWGSTVGVYVTSERSVPRGDSKKLLAAVSDNLWLELEYFGREVPKVVADHFLKGEAHSGKQAKSKEEQEYRYAAYWLFKEGAKGGYVTLLVTRVPPLTNARGLAG